MSSEDEKGRDTWHRITLRLPSELHRKLLDSAGALSVNAAIVQRLEDSFGDKLPQLDHIERLRKELNEREARIFERLDRDMERVEERRREIIRIIEDWEKKNGPLAAKS